MTTTLITDANLKKLLSNYFYNKPQLPEDLRDKVLNDWDVSQVTDMKDLFTNYVRHLFEPLNKWNVSNVTNMYGMFRNCMHFNHPLNEWNVSKVTDMSNMFNECSSFNQPLNGWNVSNVSSMEAMFVSCEAFNQPLDAWNVSNVTNMSLMFSECCSFNQPLEHWNVGHVTNMRGMFSGCNSFNQPLNAWNVRNVFNMRGMFSVCMSFNQPLENWDVSQVTIMSNMFYNCDQFNQSLEHWNVRKLRDTTAMFDGCSVLNQSFVSWELNVSTEHSRNMFDHCPLMREENKPRMLPPDPVAVPRTRTMKERLLEMCDGLVPVPIGNSSNGTVIHADATGWDVVGDEEVVILDFLKKDAKNIVFLSNSQYYPMNKDTLRNTILTNGSNIKYACSHIGGTAVLDVPYLNMKSVGLVVNFLVNIAEIMFVLKEPAVQAMELVNSGRTLETTISYDYLYGTDNQRAYGASHCQEGQDGIVANLQRVLTEETEVGVGGETETEVGGRRRRTKRTKRKGRRTRTKRRKGKRTRRKKRNKK